MTRFTSSIAVASAFACATVLLAQGQGQDPDDPFFDHGDRGETIHVLPAHASIRAHHDAQPIYAPPSNDAQVYPASYGSGKLTNHGGPQIGGPNGASFIAIYWNGQVAGSTATSLGYFTIADEIASFIVHFSGSNYSNSATDDYTVIQQYGAHDVISPVLSYNGKLVDSQQTKGMVKDGDIQRYLAGLFQSGRLQANANVLYGVYFPSGMRISLQGSSCSSFCGYHNDFTYQGTSIKYAVFPYLDCPACSLTGRTVADMLTIVTSHEIREAVTDPRLNAWYDASGYEADDKCAWHNLYQMNSGMFWVQPEFSNGGGTSPAGVSYPGPGCVVPTAASPGHH